MVEIRVGVPTTDLDITCPSGQTSKCLDTTRHQNHRVVSAASMKMLGRHRNWRRSGHTKERREILFGSAPESRATIETRRGAFPVLPPGKAKQLFPQGTLRTPTSIHPKRACLPDAPVLQF